MRTPADTDTGTTQDSEGRGHRPPAYGVPSPDLLARAYGVPMIMVFLILVVLGLCSCFGWVSGVGALPGGGWVGVGAGWDGV
jgi:hypothetical protein